MLASRRTRRKPARSHRPVLALGAAILFLGACGGNDFTGSHFPALQTGDVEGFVRDLDQPGTPVLPGLRVVLTGPNRVTTSDPNGFYRFEDVPPGFYKVTAQRPGNPLGALTSQVVQVVADQTVSANLEFGTGQGDPTAQPPPNAQTVAFLSSNAPDSVLFTSTSGTDLSVDALNIAPPLNECRYNRARPSEFVCESGGVGTPGIFIQDTGGGGATPVIDTPVAERHPDFSPDGNRVVYEADKDLDGAFEIYTIQRDGTGETLLVDDFDPATGGTFDSRDPAWSPDGVTILFVSRRTDLLATADQRDYEVQAVPAAGGPILVLTDDLLDDRDPTWHPDSLTIAYAKRASGFFQLFLSTATPVTAEAQLTNTFVDDRDPAISVDGRAVAWLTRSNFDAGNPDSSVELAVADLVGTTLARARLLTDNPSSVTLASPDFRPIVP